MLIEGAWNVHSSCILVAFILMHLQCTLEVQNSSQIMCVDRMHKTPNFRLLLHQDPEPLAHRHPADNPDHRLLQLASWSKRKRGRCLPLRKRFVWLSVRPSDARFFFTTVDFDDMKVGSGTCCLIALEVRYSRMSAVGLYFLTANFASELEISRLSSSRSKSPSANVMGFHLSETCAKMACSKSVICDVMHLLTRCSSVSPR